ncbi:MAG: methyltransferase domain-containing protein [Spirochaetaceae bacterium]|nr:MAG: methyltransferase domain-containing protein [Spirochaetaceae bacterium]
MNALEMADGTLDIVTGGYALRNAPDLEHTLREIFRVLRPGGTAAFLEFSRARHPLAGTVQLGILRVWGRLWGLILHGDPEVYAYIARSLAGFPDRIELEELFSRVGFRECPGRTLMMGFARITVVTRP